jgi:hypothetical protein
MIKTASFPHARRTTLKVRASCVALGDDVGARLRLADPNSALEELLALLPDTIPSRRLPIADAVGRVLAETLTARGAVPPVLTQKSNRPWNRFADEACGRGFLIIRAKR